MRRLAVLVLSLGMAAPTVLAVQADDDQAQATFNRGLKSYFDERFEDASREFGLSLELQSKNSSTAFWLAISLTRSETNRQRRFPRSWRSSALTA